MQKWEYLFVYSDDSGWGLVAAAAVTSEPVKPVPTPMTPVQTPPDAAGFPFVGGVVYGQVECCDQHHRSMW